MGVVMIDAQGGVTGGATIDDFLRAFARDGYTGHFVVHRDGRIECSACHRRLAPRDVTVRSMRRVEGASDPSDMSVVGALECTNCGAHGTATFLYGVHAPPEHAEALRNLHQERATQRTENDASLVHDSGWLRGPLEP